MVLFVAHSVLLSPLLALRFLVLAPIGLLIPPFHRSLERKASSLTFNPLYSRSMNQRERRALRHSELAILACWSVAIAMLIAAGAPIGRIVIVYASIVAIIAITNSLRTLGAHKYRSDGEHFDKAGQVADSVDIPESRFAFIWAPVGLRYHALHHYFPAVPYHHLAELEQRILERRRQPYEDTVVRPSLTNALSELWSDQPANAKAEA
jgi:fatty acid desaturase